MSGKGYASGFEGLIGYVNGLLPSNEVIGQGGKTSAAMSSALSGAVTEEDPEDKINEAIEARMLARKMTALFSEYATTSNPKWLRTNHFRMHRKIPLLLHAWNTTKLWRA